MPRETEDVKDLLRERNGIDSRITSVSILATGAESLSLHVKFEDNVTMTGACENRGRITVLALDVQGLIRDEMKGPLLKRGAILWAITLAAALVGYMIFQGFQSHEADHIYAQQASEMRRLEAPYQRELNELNPSDQQLLSQAEEAVSKGNLAAEVNFLARQQVAQLRQQIIDNKEDRATASDYSAPPWWSTSNWLLFAVAIFFAAAVFGAMGFILPGGRSVFLIGEEKDRQARRDSRREKLIWQVAAALVIAILAGLIVAHV